MFFCRALLLLVAVVDAGELVGVGMDKPAPLPVKPSGPDPLQQPHSGPTQDSAYISSSSAPASEWHSNGTSIAQPASNSVSCDSKKLAPRIFTFGIGPYCNHYFLKRLAGAHRGLGASDFQPTWRTSTPRQRHAWLLLWWRSLIATGVTKGLMQPTTQQVVCGASAGVDSRGTSFLTHLSCVC